jgi:leucine rich repeat (LRR) protein
MAALDVRKKFSVERIYRGSQVIFGERQHLQEVLRSVERASLPRRRKQTEAKQISSLIRARTEELNRMNPSWDRKFKKARNPKTTSRELLRLAATLTRDDYLLARSLTEHPEAPSELLTHFASHPYAAVRENVARHPRTPPQVLRKLAEDSREPLWFLVACNPSTPQDLRQRLRTRMRQMAVGRA